MSFLHVLEALNLVTIIALLFQIRMMMKVRKSLTGVRERLQTSLAKLSIELAQLEKMNELLKLEKRKEW